MDWGTAPHQDQNVWLGIRIKEKGYISIKSTSSKVGWSAKRRGTLHEAFALHCRSQSASILGAAEKYRRLQQPYFVKENINKMVAEVRGQNPHSIPLEDLNVSSTLNNHHLSKARCLPTSISMISATKLTGKCKANEIELRVVVGVVEC
ncbi:hypothetical protein [Trichococcus palustris]|uniref:hypothetical protein n=1 Tax=Trichococcus palustris TaxID=140314 RepID=UPI000B35BB0A|nr:hypothetical protein [Trichococcus palustris]